MTKKDLIEKVAGSLSLPKNQTTVIVDAIFETMAEMLEHCHEVRIDKFGVFQPWQKAARTVNNAFTIGPIDVPAKMTVKFKLSSHLKARLNP